MTELLEDLPDRRGAPTWPDNEARMAPLQTRLGYAFTRPALLRVALTHPTWVNEHARAGWPSNACLEFFGDAVLALLSTEALWRRFPALPEGVLTRLRASLVSEPALAEAARRLDLGPSLWVAHRQAELREHDGSLADAAEAVLGAAFLDARAAGRDPLASSGVVFQALLGPRLAALRPDDGKPAKARLQEWAQARWRRPPVYVPLGDRPAHDRSLWRVRAEVTCSDGLIVALAEGEGPSLRAAESAAAETALDRIDRGELG
ncbi:ribonuclease III family protein [Nannocystis bainbridge]|uniref:Ribonuclease 3 n=1 Tax=Nannocystis bainbridge TaxID=2995303 RepID=A0ABT5E2E2_9BACT|nr:ribonuclease III domain-containing protein [Nannocystis bainbridge]MDC0720019.1 ribonuclease III domain-containing protein [Nannocystis bainbridge]